VGLGIVYTGGIAKESPVPWGALGGERPPFVRKKAEI